MKSHGAPVNIAFNPNITEHIMIAFEKQVVFTVWVRQKSFTQFLFLKFRLERPERNF